MRRVNGNGIRFATVRRFAGPVRPLSTRETVTIQPKFTRGILRLTDQLAAALNADDPVATARTARRLLAALRHPLALAREELVEEDRPAFRRSRRT